METYDDGNSFVIGEVLAWDPPHRLAVGWRAATLRPRPGPPSCTCASTRSARQTRVKVEHFGWDGIPQAHAARHGFPLAPFQLRFAEWWQVLLKDLAEVAARDPL